jgi:hypothetical protein
MVSAAAASAVAAIVTSPVNLRPDRGFSLHGASIMISVNVIAAEIGDDFING